MAAAVWAQGISVSIRRASQPAQSPWLLAWPPPRCFPHLLLGIFSTRVTREGAILGMLSGIGVTLAYVFQHKGIMFIPGTSFLGELPPNWFLGIEPNAFGVVGAMVNFGVTLGVTRFTTAPPDSVQQLVEEIRVPASP